MKIKFLSLVVTILSASLFISCSSTKYMTDKDDTIDFIQYKTYNYHGWAEESNKLLTPFDQERIEKALGLELNKRGLEYNKESGDLIVTLYIVTEQKTKTTATTTGMGGGYGYGYGGYRGYGPGYGWGGVGMTTMHTSYNEYDYVVGTLIIDIYDAKGKKLIWESVAKGTINEKTKGREQRIKSTVTRMMIKYPVKPTK